MKKAAALFVICITVALLSACGSLFDKEYVSTEEYVLPAAPVESFGPQDRISVSNYSKLESAILELAKSGKTDGIILFNESYEGDVKNDIANACWQVRTQDALCAYCVENISYELSKIVTYYEARISVKYAESAAPIDEVIKLNYTSGIEDIILKNLEECTPRAVILIQYSSNTAESMESLVSKVYYDNPLCALHAPGVTVNLYRGAGMQRLYELSFNYGDGADAVAEKREQIRALDIWGETDAKELSDFEKALWLCEYLAENCEYTEETNCNTAFSALLDGKASSEGFALAYNELCKNEGLECTIVTGQKEWQKYYWNMLRIDESYYHVDVSDCIENGLSSGFLLNDEKMWSEYRWDMGAYPSCDGEMVYTEKPHIDGILPEEPAEEGGEQETEIDPEEETDETDETEEKDVIDEADETDKK